MRFSNNSTLLTLEEVNVLYRSFLIVEILIHSIGIAITALFFVLILRFPVFHVNLRWILKSFCICFSLTSVMRSLLCIFMICCLEKIQREENAFLLKLEDILIKARDACLYVGALHMLLLALERLFATIRSKTYENEKNITVIHIAISILWIGSLVMMFYFKDDGKLTSYIFAGLYAVCDLTAIVVMIIIYRLNFQMIRSSRGSLQFSHGYQVRENLLSSTFLYRIFLVCALLSVLGLLCFVGYVYYDEPIVYRLFGFGFDITTAIPTSLIPGLIISSNGKLRDELRNYWGKLRKTSNTITVKQAKQFVDFEGKKVPMKVEDEQLAYFNLYKEQWNYVPKK